MKIYLACTNSSLNREEFVLSKVKRRLWSYWYLELWLKGFKPGAYIKKRRNKNVKCN